MPAQSYPIGGKVYDNNRVPLVGVTVFLIDTTTQEQIVVANYKETNSNGSYILNAQHLPGEYNNGDGYEVRASLKGYSDGRVSGTIVQSGGGDTDKDIFLEVINHKLSATARNQLREMNLKGPLSRYKQSFMVGANNRISNSAAFVITSGGFGWGKGYTKVANPVINLKPGQVAYIEKITHQVRTASKVNAVEVVKCSAADGGGTPVAVSGQNYIANGTLVESKPDSEVFANPIRIEYNSVSAKSIGLRVVGTGSSTYIDVKMEGYVLEE